MANFSNQLVTNAGTNIITQVIAGTNTFNFTRVALGSGTIATADMPLATALAHEEMSLDIASMSHKDNRCSFNAMLLGSNAASSFAWSEVGLFGEDSTGTEVLYFYAVNSDTDTVSPSIDQKLIQISTYLSNNATITATITPIVNMETLEITTDKGVIGSYDGSTATTVKITPSVIGAQVDLTKCTTVDIGNGTLASSQDVIINLHANDGVNSNYSASIKASSGTNDLEINTANGTGTVKVNGTLTVNDKEVFDAGDTIPVTNGGTGKTKVTKGALVVGDDINALTELSGVGALYAATSKNPVFGTLPVSLGGTSAISHTVGAVLLGNGTGAFQQKTGKGAFYASTSGSPTFGTLPTALGGTGKTNYTANRLVYASNASTLAQVAHPTGEEGFLWSDTSGAPKFMTLSDVVELLRLNGLGGDFVGKKMSGVASTSIAASSSWNYSNSKGGLLRIKAKSSALEKHDLIVDGTTIYSNSSTDYWVCISEDGTNGYWEIYIPFESSVKITNTSTSSMTISGMAYINQ